MLQRVATINGCSRPLRLHLAPGRTSRHPAEDGLLLPSSASAAGGDSGGVRSRSPGVALGSRSSSVQKPASPRLPLLTDPSAPAFLGPGLSPDGGMHNDGAETQGPHGGRPATQPSHGPLHAEASSSSKGGGGAAGLRQRARRLRHVMALSFGAIFGPRLRRTTLLLFGVWFTNALTYYGLVLLTTALQTAAKKELCTPSGAPNLDSGDYVVRGTMASAGMIALASRLAAALCRYGTIQPGPKLAAWPAWVARRPSPHPCLLLMQAILVTTLAEAPGLLAAALLIDGPGRRRSLQVGLAVCAAALASLVADPPRLVQLALLFTARACIEGAFR